MNRSVWPTASGTPAVAAAAISSSASASERAIGFSTSTGDAGFEKRHRDVAMHLGRHRDGDGVDLPEQIARVEERPGAVGSRDLVGARLVGVDDGDQLDAGQRRQNPRVMLPR